MRSELTDVPIKNLLKQVYAAHTTKVKNLEDEIEELKNKLCESENKLKVQDSDCKRCAELEEAFTTCKAALEEQTKWFENFGQKFSIFNSSENKISSKTSKLHDDIMQIHNDSSFGSEITQLNNTKEKSSITKKTLLKNLMSLTPDKLQDSLDLCTMQFPGNLGPSCSSLNFDSAILAPDTVDVILDVQNNDLKQSRAKLKALKSSNLLNNATDKSKDSTMQINLGKKRSCSSSSESDKSPSKKPNNGLKNYTSVEKETVKKEIVKKQDSDVEKHIKSNQIENLNPKLRNSRTNDLKTSKTNTHMNIDDNKEKELSILDLEIRKDTHTENFVKIPIIEREKKHLTKLEHTISKDSMFEISPSIIPLNKIEKAISKQQPIIAEDTNVEKEKKCQTKLGRTISKESTVETSPSIIPFNKKNEKDILQKQSIMAEDISDFQITSINKNPPEMVDAWKSSDKRKTKKERVPSIKGLKITSKFKMSLDTLPPNYKKPNLRQTKLSKSIFQPKTSTPDAKKVLNDSSNNSEGSRKNSTVNKSNKTNTVDFDATCIPENFKFNAESCDEDSDDEKSILLIQDESSNESLTSPDVSIKIKDKGITQEDASKENKEKANFEDFISSKKQITGENLNSFDRLPKRDEPNYKYKEETVRKKSERKQLNGFDCKECEKFFADLGLSEEDKQKRLNKCSRHRSKFAPPATPEHFWELDFPDTAECKARGYLNETQKVTLKTHRRRPL